MSDSTQAYEGMVADLVEKDAEIAKLEHDRNNLLNENLRLNDVVQIRAGHVTDFQQTVTNRDAEIAALRAEHERLENVLLSRGFRRCDIAACNCGSWHQFGGFALRFREINEATNDEWRNGETLLARIERIMRDLQALRDEVSHD
jgi:hypothetical protein